MFRFETATPVHTFKSAVKAVGGGRLVELTARDHFDERLAAFLLDQVELATLPPLGGKTIHVFPATYPAPWRFNRVVVVPPRIADRYELESNVLRRILYWLLPAYDGEFADRADREEFWHQIHRKDGRHVPVVDWTRPPKRTRVGKS